MGTPINFLKQLNLGRVIVLLVAGVALFLNVACSSGNVVGARPNNLPVQAGGQNDPHKGGGDGYTEYKASTDPTVKAKRNDAALIPGPLMAAIDPQGSNATESRGVERKTLREAAKDQLFDARRIPERLQTDVDRGNPDVPNAKILSKVGKSFTEASKHLTGDTDEAIKRGDPLANEALGN